MVNVSKLVMESLYIPISCSYYDRLEAWAVRREQVHIIFKQPEHDSEQQAEGIIADLFSKDKAEYLELRSGERIRLDYIISVNNIAVPVSNACER